MGGHLKDSLFNTRIYAFFYVDNERKALGECGAIEAVVDAMKARPSNADVCKNGCGALGSIAMDNGKCFNIKMGMGEQSI